MHVICGWPRDLSLIRKITFTTLEIIIFTLIWNHPHPSQPTKINISHAHKSQEKLPKSTKCGFNLGVVASSDVRRVNWVKWEFRGVSKAIFYRFRSNNGAPWKIAKKHSQPKHAERSRAREAQTIKNPILPTTGYAHNTLLDTHTKYKLVIKMCGYYFSH